MRLKFKNKQVFSVLLFVLPYIFVEFANIILVTIDRSLSNSIGKIAIIVFASFLSLDSAINIIQGCISQAHGIVLARDRKNNNSINTTSIFLQLISNIFISFFIFIFANKITYIFTLENSARDILTILLKLKAIGLPILAIGYIPQNDLKIKNKTHLIFIATLISSIFNILGDIISIKCGFNEVGIYVATILSTIINTLLLFIFSKYKYDKIKITYIKEIIYHVKDLIFNKVIQQIAYILLVRIASSFGTDIYVIHCICEAVTTVLLQLTDGYYSGLLVSYSDSIENKETNLLKKVNKVGIYSLIFSTIFVIIIPYPAWYFLGREVPWNDCGIYIYLYITEFFTYVINNNYLAYLAANKDTKCIRLTSFIGGICIRIPLLYLIKYFNLGLVGIGLVCTVDRIVRTIYLKCYIKGNSNLYKN